jgi:3-hydroxyisobutyrate dehydrogenase-like beta-hydroxyacid dehydrogenase
MKVAFLGLGTMGAAMAANVLKRGYALTVWNRTPGRAPELVAAGAREAATPADAARDADVVLTMLADPAAVQVVLAGNHGALAQLRAGALVVDMSTIDPATARRMDAEVRAGGGRFIDAPVSGTRKPAVDGGLLILAGGEAADVEAARPVLEAMGRIVHVGGVGQGMAMKLVLNGLGAHMLTGFAAMMVLGAKQGLNPRTVLDVILGGAFASQLYAGKGPRMIAREFAPDFTVRLMRKDQDLVLATAEALGYPMPTLRAVRDQLTAAIDAGFGDDDMAGLVRLFESWAGTTVAEK